MRHAHRHTVRPRHRLPACLAPPQPRNPGSPLANTPLLSWRCPGVPMSASLLRATRRSRSCLPCATTIRTGSSTSPSSRRSSRSFSATRRSVPQHGQSAPLSSAPARLLRLLRARLAAPGNSALPGKGQPTLHPATRPRVVELAASKAADSTAFDHLGAAKLGKMDAQKKLAAQK